MGGALLGAEHLKLPQPERFRLEWGELLLCSSDGLNEQTNAERVRLKPSSQRFDFLAQSAPPPP